MQTGSFRFDRLEFAGSLGDLGTLIPLSVALMMITGLSVTTVLLMAGLFYIFSGIYYRLPIPVQPLKVVAAVAIAYPEKVTLQVMAATGLIFGVLLLVLSFTGTIDRLAKLFTKPVIRGIQLGLGFILMNRGIHYILSPEVFLHNTGEVISFMGLPANLFIGILGGIIALLFISSERFPAAMVLVSTGAMVGIFSGALNGVSLSLGPTPVSIYVPSLENFVDALILLVIPQIPLTLGNAVIGTSDTCRTLFGTGEKTGRATYRGFATTMGLMNIVTGAVAGMPMCHGAGGLAAHYRFGARTGGSNIMIGAVFIGIALLFGKIGISILSSIPMAVLGVLLLFAGLELALLVRDIEEKKDLFVAFLIAGIGLSTTNMAAAFLVGIVVWRLIRWRNITL